MYCITIIDLTSRKRTAMGNFLETKNWPGNSKRFRNARQDMLQQKNGIYLVEIDNVPRLDPEDEDDYVNYYALFAGFTHKGRKLRVLDRDQRVSGIQFLVYTVPARQRGKAIRRQKERDA